MSNLFIPKKVHVGFNKRSDTFTGKLGFIIPENDDGTLRQEKSWNGWKDASIEPLVIENTPQPNFVLNKGIKRYGHFSNCSAKIRIYDPRDFEFEITVNNLMALLMHSDVSKRDIMESCVYAWSGKDLVLLPTNSEEYQNAVKFTEKANAKFSLKDLVKGHSYAIKSSDHVFVYLGHYKTFEIGYRHEQIPRKQKQHVFYNVSHGWFEELTAAKLSHCVDDNVHSDFSNLVEKLETTSTMVRPIVNFEYTDAVIAEEIYFSPTDTALKIFHYPPANFDVDRSYRRNVYSSREGNVRLTELIPSRGYYAYGYSSSYDYVRANETLLRMFLSDEYVFTEVPDTPSYVNGYRKSIMKIMKDGQSVNPSSINIPVEKAVEIMNALGYYRNRYAVLDNGVKINLDE